MKTTLAFLAKLALLMMMAIHKVVAQTDNNKNICQDLAMTKGSTSYDVHYMDKAIDDDIPANCMSTDPSTNCMTIDVNGWVTISLGDLTNLSTIVFLSDNAGGATGGGTRTYGTSADPFDTSTN